MTFENAYYSSRMTLEEIAELMQLSIKTINRYKETNKAPRAVIVALKMIGGHLPEFSSRNDFTGWSFGSGYLWSPAGERFTSGDVLAMRIDLALIRSQRVEIEQLKSRSLVNGSSNVIPFPVKYIDRRKHLA
jgi:hypothetical protein